MSPLSRPLLTALATTGLLLVAAPSPAANKAKAEALAGQAIRAFEAERYGDAGRLFDEAWQESGGTPATLLRNAARAWQFAIQLDLATARWQSFRTHPETPAEKRAEAEAHLKAIAAWRRGERAYAAGRHAEAAAAWEEADGLTTKGWPAARKWVETANQAAQAEDKRQAEEERRQAEEEKRRAEAAAAEDRRLAEEKRLAEAAAAEEKRQAETERRRAAAARQAEAPRQAELKAAQAIEEERRARAARTATGSGLRTGLISGGAVVAAAGLGIVIWQAMRMDGLEGDLDPGPTGVYQGLTRSEALARQESINGWSVGGETALGLGLGALLWGLLTDTGKPDPQRRAIREPGSRFPQARSLAAGD
jgi:colicin import membrane protein